MEDWRPSAWIPGKNIMHGKCCKERNREENFKLILDKWNLVSEKGLPEDGTWCFVAWKNCTGEYEWAIGGYQEAEHQFYVNFGMGGMVLEEEEAVAWAELFKDEVFTAE